MMNIGHDRLVSSSTILNHISFSMLKMHGQRSKFQIAFPEVGNAVGLVLKCTLSAQRDECSALSLGGIVLGDSGALGKQGLAGGSRSWE